jgi:hypothetical protein
MGMSRRVQELSEQRSAEVRLRCRPPLSMPFIANARQAAGRGELLRSSQVQQDTIESLQAENSSLHAQVRAALWRFTDP